MKLMRLAYLKMLSPVATSFFATGSSLNPAFIFSITALLFSATSEGGLRLAAITGDNSGRLSSGFRDLYCKHWKTTYKSFWQCKVLEHLHVNISKTFPQLLWFSFNRVAEKKSWKHYLSPSFKTMCCMERKCMERKSFKNF